MAKIEPRPANPFPLVRMSRPCDFSLSPGQERLWWLRQLDPSHNQYHVMEGWRVAAALDREAIAAAFAGLVQRHEVLRTRFVLRADGAIVQQGFATSEPTRRCPEPRCMARGSFAHCIA